MLSTKEVRLASGRCARRVVAGMVLVSTLLLAAQPSHAAEANLVRNGDAELGNAENWGRKFTIVTDDVHSGKNSFQRKGPITILSDDFIPVDGEKTYVLSGWFKSQGEEPSRVYLGYVPYDENKTRIVCANVSVTAGSETALTAAVSKGDTVLKIANGAKWVAKSSAVVAFEVDASGEYKDLPNRKLSSSGIASVENKGDFWEVTLLKPCGMEYPAGTLVRQHNDGGAYIYNAAASKVIPKEWTECRGLIKGIAKSGSPTNRWWPGTKYARIMVMPHYKQAGPGFVLLVDDISMTAQEPE